MKLPTIYEDNIRAGRITREQAVELHKKDLQLKRIERAAPKKNLFDEAHQVFRTKRKR